MVKEGTIVEATIIAAPRSTKNQARQRDLESKSNTQWTTGYFGMKAHIETDSQGHEHSVAVTLANVHDVTVTDKCLCGAKARIYGAKAYVRDQHK